MKPSSTFGPEANVLFQSLPSNIKQQVSDAQTHYQTREELERFLSTIWNTADPISLDNETTE